MSELSKESSEHTQKSSRFLMSAGLLIVRFWNKEILKGFLVQEKRSFSLNKKFRANVRNSKRISEHIQKSQRISDEHGALRSKSKILAC